jgi:hypothetical protein
VNEKLLTETLQAYPNVRIACVAAIIRWNPYTQPVNNDVPETVEDFFNQGYVNDTQGRAEMLYIQRAKRPGDL